MMRHVRKTTVRLTAVALATGLFTAAWSLALAPGLPKTKAYGAAAAAAPPPVHPPRLPPSGPRSAKPHPPAEVNPSAEPETSEESGTSGSGRSESGRSEESETSGQPDPTGEPEPGAPSTGANPVPEPSSSAAPRPSPSDSEAAPSRRATRGEQRRTVRPVVKPGLRQAAVPDRTVVLPEVESVPDLGPPERVPADGSAPRTAASADATGAPGEPATSDGMANANATAPDPLSDPALAARLVIAGTIALAFAIGGLITIAVRRRQW